MSEIHSPNETKATVKLCPKCSSASVEELSPSISLGGEQGAKCLACGSHWRISELIIAPFRHEMGTDEQVIQSMMSDLRNILGKHFAKPFGSFLLKWGFISAGVTPKELSLYVVAMAKAIIVSILEIRRQIEREKQG